MQLRQFEVFYAVMVTGSVSAAAKLVNITQPGATKILKQLERRLGFELFARTGGRLRPSSEAETLFKEVQLLYSQLENIKQLAKNLKHGIGQSFIRIGCTTALAHDVLPIAIQDLRSARPECTIELHTAHARGTIDALMLREIDIGFALDPPDHPAIEKRVIATGELVCIAPPGFSFDAAEFPCSEFSAHPFISMHRDDPLGVLFRTTCHSLGIEISSKISVRTYLMARSLVQRDEGLSVVDQYTALHGDAGAVKIFRLKPRIPFAVTALWLKDSNPSLLIKALLASFKKAEKKVSAKLPALD